jgi:hypothetical protein
MMNHHDLNKSFANPRKLNHLFLKIGRMEEK